MDNSIMLRSFDKYDNYLNLNTRVIQCFNNTYFKINGWYKYIGDKFSAIYVKEGDLYYQYDSYIFSVSSAKYKAQLTILESDIRIFSLLGNYKLVHSFEYSIKHIFDNIEPFPFVEEEDFDWGFFLLNIINSDDRKRSIVDELTTDFNK